MTMYLPNRDIRSTGYEIAEFLEAPAVPDAPPSPAPGEEARTVAANDNDDDNEPD